MFVVLFTFYGTFFPSKIQNHVSFLHEEFMKLPAFPRKALEAEFSLYNGKGGEASHTLVPLLKLFNSYKKKIHTLSFTCKISLCFFFTLQEIYGLDTLHKFSWVKVNKNCLIIDLVCMYIQHSPM